jgi:hypothetical protein
MAQTKKKRRRKHKGTAAGTIDRAGRTGKGGAGGKKLDAAARREQRLNTKPTWRGSINRAAVAAVVFAILYTVVSKGKPASIAVVAVAMFAIYIPLGYATDNALYNFRQRRKAAAGKQPRR